MKKCLLLLPAVLLLSVTGCGAINRLENQVTESTQSIYGNIQAVQESTAIIRENARLVDESTRAIEENKRLLESVSH